MPVEQIEYYKLRIIALMDRIEDETGNLLSEIPGLDSIEDRFWTSLDRGYEQALMCIHNELCKIVDQF